MSSPSYALYKWIMKNEFAPSCEEFLKALVVGFVASMFVDPKATLKELKQTTTVEKYQAQFENLSTKVTDLLETWLISFFIAGLKDHLKWELMLKQPKAYFHVASLATLH